MIETNMPDALMAEQLNEITSAIPLKRIGNTIELAGACLFLASELSGYITGATLEVNGAIHIHLKNTVSKMFIKYSPIFLILWQ